MKSNRIAANIMFALGILYMTLIVYAMTPWTVQLDDIKEAIMYVLAPLPLVAYLLLVGLGYLETPRRGILWTFVAYMGVMVVSTILSKPYCQWQGWVGIMMQLLLLGPFIGFFCYSGIQRRLARVAVYTTLLALGAIVFGLLIYGTTTPSGEKSGLGTWICQYYQQDTTPLIKRQSTIKKQMNQFEAELGAAADDKTAQAKAITRLQDLENEFRLLERNISEIRSGFIYRLASTFDDTTAKAHTMSTILNRQFYAAFLLLVIPLAIGSFLISGAWFGRFLAARTESSRMDALFSKQAFWQILCLFVVVTGFYSLMKTESKESIYGGQIVIVVMLVGLYLFWQRRPWKHRGQVLATLAGFFGIALPLFFIAYGPKLLKIFQPGDSGSKVTNFSVSIVSRQIIWGGAFDIFFENPIWGAGPKSFGILFPYFRRPDYNLWEISHRTLSSHNYFIDIFCDTGILGVLTFGAFFGFIVWKALVSIRTDPDPKNSTLTLCALAGLAGFMMNNMISPNARWVIGSNQLWMALGILAGIVNRPRLKEGDGEREARHAPTRLQSRIALGVFGFALIGWAYSASYGVNFFNAARANAEGQGIIRENDPDSSIFAQAAHIRDGVAKALRQPGITPQQQSELQARQKAELEKLEKQRIMALDCFEETVRLSRYYTTSYYKLATMYLAGRNFEPTRVDYENALGAYKKLQELGPEYAQIRLNLSTNIYARLKKYEKALEQGRLAAKMTVEVSTTDQFLRQLKLVSETRNAPFLSQYDLIDSSALILQIRAAKDPVSLYIRDHLTSDSRQALDAFQPTLTEKAKSLKTSLYGDMQALLEDPKLYTAERFANVANIPQSVIAELRATKPEYMALIRLNRELFLLAWPSISLNEEDDMLMLAERLRKPSTPLEKYVVSRLSGSTRKQMATFTTEDGQKSEYFCGALLIGLNQIIKDPALYDAKRFAQVKLSTTTQLRIDEKFFEDNVRLPELNRALLGDAYPDKIGLDTHEEAFRTAKRLVDWWERINTSKGAEIERDQLQQNRNVAAQLLYATASDTGIRAEVVKASNHLLTLTQDDPAALEKIAEFSLKVRDYQALREIAQKSVERAPFIPELRSTLALSCLLDNDPREAKRQILILEKSAPSFEDIPYLYFKLYQKTNAPEKAREYAQKYAPATPEGKYAKEIAQYLATPVGPVQPTK